MTIHSQRRPEPDPLAGSVALALGCAAGVGAAELVDADEVTDGTAEVELGAAEGLELAAAGELVLWVGEELVVWLVERLAIALLMPLLMLELHAVVVLAAPRIVAARSRLAIGRRINGPFPHLQSWAQAGDAPGGTSALWVQPGQSPLAPRHPERMNVISGPIRANSHGAELGRCSRPGSSAGRIITQRQSRDDDHRGFAAVRHRHEPHSSVRGDAARVGTGQAERITLAFLHERPPH